MGTRYTPKPAPSFEPLLAASWNTGKGVLIRGTSEWDARERQRELRGCRCLSYGPLRDSLKTQPKSGEATLYWTAAWQYGEY